MADFVGSTSGLRRLRVIPLDPAHVRPLDDVRAGDLGSTVDVRCTLGEALTVLLRGDRGTVGVTDGPGSSGCSPQRHPSRAMTALADMAEQQAV